MLLVVGLTILLVIVGSDSAVSPPSPPPSGSQAVEPATSLISSVNLYSAGYSAAPAGSWNSLYVQLRSASGAPVSASNDSLLSVACSPDASAPLDAVTGQQRSFCEAAPVITPLGQGLYQVAFSVGTIWGAHKVFPPAYNTMLPLPASYFQGNNQLAISFNGTSLQGSPVKVLCQAAYEVDTSYAAVNINNPAMSMASSEDTYFARFYQTSDSFTNWIRLANLTSRVQASIVCTGGGCDVGAAAMPLTLTWWSTNWWLDMHRVVTVAGKYQLSATYTRVDGALEPLRLVNTNMSVTYSAAFEVRSGPVEAIRVTVLGGVSVAGQPVSLSVQAVDGLGNPTWLVAPADYLYFMPYRLADQDLSLLQVSALPPSGTSSLNASTSLTLDKGAVNASFLATVAGTYNVSVKVVRATSWVAVTVASAPVLAANSQLSVTSPTVAGGTLHLTFAAFDAYNNAAAPNPLQLLVIVSSNASLQATTTVLNSSCLSVAVQGLVAAGTYTLHATYNGSVVPVQDDGMFVVQPNPSPSTYRTIVYGSGAGTPADGLNTSSTAVATIIAGQSASLFINARDNYGNVILGSALLFQLNAEFMAACINFSASVGAVGNTTLRYSLPTAGWYQFTLSGLAGQVIYRGALQVLPAAVAPALSSFSVQAQSVSGGITQLQALLVDAFNNTVPSLAVTDVYASIIPCGTLNTSATNTAVTLAFSNNTNTYSGSVQLKTSGCYLARALYRQYPLGNTTINWSVLSGPINTTMCGFKEHALPSVVAAGGTLRLLLLSRDSYGNPASAASLLGAVQSVVLQPPCASCDASVTTVAAGPDTGAPALVLRLPEPGVFNCTITFSTALQSSVLVEAGISVLAPPPSPQPPQTPLSSPVTPDDSYSYIPTAPVSSPAPPPSASSGSSQSGPPWIIIGASVAGGVLAMVGLWCWCCWRRRRNHHRRRSHSSSSSSDGASRRQSVRSTKKAVKDALEAQKYAMSQLSLPSAAFSPGLSSPNIFAAGMMSPSASIMYPSAGMMVPGASMYSNEAAFPNPYVVDGQASSGDHLGHAASLRQPFPALRPGSLPCPAVRHGSLPFQPLRPASLPNPVLRPGSVPFPLQCPPSVPGPTAHMDSLDSISEATSSQSASHHSNVAEEIAPDHPVW